MSENSSNALKIFEKAPSLEALSLDVTPVSLPKIGPDDCLIQVCSAGINMSDVKATLGQMPHAVWPRTPGRDYAGIVLDGPADLVGKEVWGSGGELGISRDGTHSRLLVVQASSVRQKPSTVSMAEAGAIGVPFITAYEGLRRVGQWASCENILILGANGRVGQAVAQLAAARGLQIFGVERTSEAFRGKAVAPVEMIDASSQNISGYVRDRTGGKGVDIVFNTVGSPYFVEGHLAMAKGAAQVFISTFERSVPFDIFTFFRGQHSFYGVDTLALNTQACAEILDDLHSGFEDGALSPFPVLPENIYTLDNAAEAYRTVYRGSGERLVIQP
ncbi:quinone oxidoreductase family protein [Paraburkholderia oxyphila]|uniref:quinone oxidoreductase family protein n=1 Tax=Paraburkholderia oxyphila TaxID=614212 RepID=UPI0004824F48|nr:zinc-binding alcohol dehydrogenase family protein [Paraburkholderia oxyphila]